MKARGAEEVGSEFRRRRRLLGLTQEDVADGAQLSLPTIRKLESGGHVTPTTVRSVAAVLEWPIDAYDRLRLGDETDSLTQTELGPIERADGLSIIEVTMQRMGLAPLDIEIAMAAVKALVKRDKG